MEPPERRNHALTKFGRPVSELALTTKGERKKGKVGRKPGKERKGVKERGSGDSRELGSNKRKESGASRGQKGPTNGITGGSSGSCRSHAQREKQPGQRLMAVYPQRSRTLETKETTKGNRGSHPMGNKQTKEKKRRGASSLGVQLEWCVVTLGGNAGVER